MISFRHAGKKNADGNSRLTTTSRTLRTYMCIKPKQTSAKRGHKKDSTGTTIRTAKSGFLRRYVQSDLAADNTQAKRQCSCCVLRLPVPIS